jgi:predicted transcriptional regulator
MMSKQRIHIGIEDANHGFDRFVEAWRKSETGELEQAEIHLNFEDFAMLSSVLTPKRLELMKTLRQHGPFSVRALAKKLERDYKNVHADASALESVDLVQRNGEGLLIAVVPEISWHTVSCLSSAKNSSPPPFRATHVLF